MSGSDTAGSAQRSTTIQFLASDLGNPRFFFGANVVRDSTTTQYARFFARQAAKGFEAMPRLSGIDH